MFIIKPVLTDKSKFYKKKKNIITFKIKKKFNKIEIKKEIKKIFGSSVLEIKTMIYYPKKIKKTYKGKYIVGKSNIFKKILIKLDSKPSNKDYLT